MDLRNTIQSLALAIAPVMFLASCASESDRVLMRRYATQDYCHMKIETRSGDPGRPNDREVVDYYGHCDDRPSPRR